jgi:iron(III) transport system ATP-binding protein
VTDLIVRDVHKSLGALKILKGASFEAQKGQIVALLGASGSGKTTLLRCVAGLERPEEGFVKIGNKVAMDSSAGIGLPPEERNIGLVFQSYALWPHRTVFENVAYGLKLRKVDSARITQRVQSILDKLGLGHLKDRYPDQLSGGQQQRVAICRALVYEPSVLLMDEPLSNLDAKLREEARYWIRKLILDLQLCAILVTHDQTEALAVADHILLLQDGTIVQEGTPIEIYSKPNSYYSADFLGTNNVIEAKVESQAGKIITFGGDGWKLEGTAIEKDRPATGKPIKAVIRVEKIGFPGSAGKNNLQMDVDASVYLGDKWEYRLSRGDFKVKAHGAEPLKSKTAWCSFPVDSVWVFAA